MYLQPMQQINRLMGYEKRAHRQIGQGDLFIDDRTLFVYYLYRTKVSLVLTLFSKLAMREGHYHNYIRYANRES